MADRDNRLLMKITFTILILAAILAVSSVRWALHAQYSQATETQPVVATFVPLASPDAVIPTITPEVKAVVTPVPTAALPDSTLITVPYAVQAPFANWDALHEDACEETSLIMVKHFLDGIPIASKQQADQEITDLVHWEEQNGYGPSITLQQLNQIAKDHFGLTNGVVVTDASIKDIKSELAAGHPMIMGMAGRYLGNPHFTAGGPNYHMLVALGYDQTGFITNDPGIWQGQKYPYTYEIFYNALHNWDPQNILNGQKAYLVFR